jgi:ribulose-phosphate 3-epimerase
VKALRPWTDKVLDVHLMIAPADPYLQAFAEAGADVITDLALVMSVNPGFGGQNFIAQAAERVRAIRGMANGRAIRIEVDGGVTAENAGKLAGSDTLVAGSAIFRGGRNNYSTNITAIRHAAHAATC